MSRILIQCGDNLENSVRVLSLATLLRDAGLNPVVMVYTKPYTHFFEQQGIEAASLYAYRLGSVAAEAAHRFGFEHDPDDLVRLPRRIAALTGEHFDRRREFVAARRALVAVDRLVKDRGIEQCVAWNGLTGAVANAMRCFVALKGGGGFIERGLLPGGVIFDPLGANGDATLACGTAFPPDADVEARHEPALQRWFPQLDAAPAPRSNALLVPLQVQRDSNVVLHSPLPTMRHLLIEAERIRDTAFPGWQILVRPHPEESPGERLNLPRLPGMELTLGGGLGTWLAQGAVALTLNSTVGLEAAIGGRGVIALGEGIYCREPFVARVDGPEDFGMLRERVDAPRANPVTWQAQLRTFLVRLLDGHQVQPVGAPRTTPEALLRHFLEGSKRKARGAPFKARGAPLSIAAEMLGTCNSNVTVHVIGMDKERFTIDYRTTNAPLTRKALESLLGAMFGIHKRYDVAARDTPADGDIAIVGPGVDITACGGYRVVLDHRLSVHPKWLTAAVSRPYQ